GIGATRVITLTLTVAAAPQGGQQFSFAPEWQHSFVTCDGQDPIDEAFTPPSVTIPFQSENTAGGGGAGGEGGSAQGRAGAEPTGAGGNDGDGADIDEEGGCGCTTIGAEPAGTLSVTAFMFAGLLLARRRR